MLASARIIAFLAVTDRQRARDFYEGVLGLTLVEDEPMALVFDANGVMLRIAPVEQTAISIAPYTVLGWEVADIRATLAQFKAHGLAPERWPQIPIDDAGICLFPDGTQVAWFKDPDGNLLSLTQFMHIEN